MATGYSERHDESGATLKRFARSRRGGAAVELAVVFPILLLLVIGVADYGRVFLTSITVANAARSGAEYGSQSLVASQDTVGMKNFANQDGNDAALDSVLPRKYCECGGSSHACTTFCSGSNAPDVFVEVTAVKTVRMLLPYPGLPGSVKIRRTATFRAQ